MNQGLSKSAIKPSSKNMLKDPSYRNPPVKRKRADETFQRFVLPKITPSYDLNSKKISSLANPTKNGKKIVVFIFSYIISSSNARYALEYFKT